MNIEDQIREHAQLEYPRESCGVIIVERGVEKYIRITNVATGKDRQFVMDKHEYCAAADRGEIIAVVHSHPDVPAWLSEADRAQLSNSEQPWWIVHVSVPDNAREPLATVINKFEPEHYEASLVGRPFAHGVLDCYSLVRDYYKRELDIELPDFERDDKWWDHGQNLYMDNLEAAGCSRVDGPLQVGDIILMQMRSPVPNHAAVYIGDGLILHHMYNRLSTRDVYSGYFQEVTRIAVRHERMHK